MAICLPLVLCIEPAAAEAPPFSLVSKLGQVRVTGSHGATIGPLAVGARLRLGRGAAAQLLIHGVSICGIAGQAQLRLAGANGSLEILELDGAVALTGPGVIHWSNWLISPDNARSRLLVTAGQVFVLEGRATARRLGSSALLPDWFVVGSAHCIASAGQAADIGPFGCAVATAKPDPALVVHAGRFAPPPRWSVSAARLTDEDFQQAKEATKRRQKLQREAAACGCTEGGGGASEGGQSGKTSSVPERRKGRLLIKIKGLPTWK